MTIEELKKRLFHLEWQFSSSRSSGPGGQNVNKVNTKIELRFDLQNSSCINHKERIVLLKKLKNRINSVGELVITCQTSRSQLKNKEIAIDHFFQLLSSALTPAKRRVATRPTKSSVERRMESKKRRGNIKSLRRGDWK